MVFENWSEVTDELPDSEAFLIVPMPAWLRRIRTTDGMFRLEPLNPFAAVLIVPRGETENRAWALAVSDHTFSVNAVDDLKMVEWARSLRDPPAAPTTSV